MKDAESILQMFDHRIRVKLSLLSLVSVCLFVFYILTISPSVSLQNRMLDRIFIALLGIVCAFSISYYLHHINNYEKTLRWLRKELPEMFLSFRLNLAEINGRIQYCDGLLTSEFHHALMEAQQLLVKAKQIAAALEIREVEIMRLTENDSAQTLGQAYEELHKELELTHDSQSDINHDIPREPIQADDIDAELDRIFSQVQKKLGIADDDAKRNEESLSRARVIQEAQMRADAAEVEEMKTEETAETSWEDRHKAILASIEKHNN